MSIKPVDMKDSLLMIELNRRQIVWQGRPNLGVEFEDARFSQSREDRICRRQEFKNSPYGNRRAVVGLNGGSAHNELSVCPRNYVYGVARVQKPQHVI